MANPDLLPKLYQRMSAEQVRYRDWLLGRPPGEILNHAAEHIVREDIVVEMEKLELTDAQAKEIDLLTYLQRFHPHQLAHVGGSTYCTREHDSLKIKNGNKKTIFLWN